MGDLLATLRRHDFALLWFGGLVSVAGDWMLLVALQIYLYQRTGGSALATGAGSSGRSERPKRSSW